jgi:hypothetical protein
MLLRNLKVLLTVGVLAFSSAQAVKYGELSDVIAKTYPNDILFKADFVKTPDWFLEKDLKMSPAIKSQIQRYNLKFDCKSMLRFTWKSVGKNTDGVFKDIQTHLEKEFKHGDGTKAEMGRRESSLINTTIRGTKRPSSSGYISLEGSGLKTYSMLATLYIENSGKDASLYLCEAKKP